MSTQGIQWPGSAQNTQNERFVNGGPRGGSNDSSHQGGMSGHGSNDGSRQGGMSGHGRREEHKVYAQNIPVTMTQESLEALFGKCGHITSARILPPKDGRNSTVAFIGFATEDSAKDAIDRMTGCVLGDCYPLRVMWPANKSRPVQSSGEGRDYSKPSPFGNTNSGGSPFGKTNSGGSPFANTNSGGSPFANTNSGGSPFGNTSSGGSPFGKTNSGESPFGGNKGDSQDHPQQSPFGNNSSSDAQNNQGYSPKQPDYANNRAGKNNMQHNNTDTQASCYGNQQNNQTMSFMSILGRGESVDPVPPTRPGGLQGYKGAVNSYGGPQAQGGDNNQYAQQPQQPSPGFNQQPQVQGYPVQQSSQQQQPNQSNQQPPPYQENTPPDQGNTPYIQSQQPPQSFAQQPQVQGYPVQQGYQQQPNQSYQQPPPQQNEMGQQMGSSSGPQNSPFSAMNGTGSESPFGGSNNRPSPFQSQQDHSGNTGFSSSFAKGRLPRSAMQDNEGSFARGDRTCHKCGETGHFARECPNQSKQGGGSTCHKCGEVGHFARECPSGSATGGGSTCHKCGEVGHFARECPSGSAAGGGGTCHKCGEVGHFARECPSGSATGGGSTCHKCGEVGHFARECPSGPATGGGSTCHKCGEVGHFARECPSGPATGGGSTCHKCGEVGHFARECPSGPATGGGSTCHKCGEVGHFARECPSGPVQGGACHRCGEMGHFARECPTSGDFNESGELQRPAPVTYVPPELPDDMDALFQDVPHSGINFDNYDNIPVRVSGKPDPPPPITSFDECGLGSQCMANIRRAKFPKPTPVQKHALPISLAGRDLMACAQTGSGKTVAFLLPTITNMINQGLPGATLSPLALCIAPTRELAVQLYKELRKYTDGTPIRSAVCYGGVSVAYQAEYLERGCHFLVATPGRLQDFVTRERVFLSGIRYLILDEADRMLDLGFGPAIRKLVNESGMTPKESRQTLMYSATFPDDMQLLAADFLKPDYLFLAVGRVGGTNLDIMQHVMIVNGNDKRDKLHEILSASGKDRTLVFVELKRVADFLACWLSENKFPTTSISSDRSQKEREAALQDFRDGRANVLVATSVAARGLDIPDVKHVVNYDLPQDIDEYVHRIGRTGRIGNEGKATSFFEMGRDDRLARSLVKVLSQAFQEVPSWLEQAAEDAVGSGYGPEGGKFASKDHRERGGGRGRSRPNIQDVTSGMSSMQLQNGPNMGYEKAESFNQTSFQAPRQMASSQSYQEENDDEWN